MLSLHTDPCVAPFVNRTHRYLRYDREKLQGVLGKTYRLPKANVGHATERKDVINDQVLTGGGVTCMGGVASYETVSFIPRGVVDVNRDGSSHGAGASVGPRGQAVKVRHSRILGGKNEVERSCNAVSWASSR